MLAAADRFEVLARVPLGEPSSATPAVAGGVMYLRTRSHRFRWAAGAWTVADLRGPGCSEALPPCATQRWKRRLRDGQFDKDKETIEPERADRHGERDGQVLTRRTHMKLQRIVGLSAVLALLAGGTGQVLAANFYVGGDGASDRNPGTASQPFATIQKAAGVAAAGDVVNIRPGIYEKTMVPANSSAPADRVAFQPKGRRRGRGSAGPTWPTAARRVTGPNTGRKSPCS